MRPEIKISDYTYILPDEKIAKYPLPVRDESKLLILKNRSVSESQFKNIGNFIPDGSLLVINDTKVVPARLIFRKVSGAFIEIFCLEPHSPVEYNLSFSSKGCSEWSCVIGNIKRFKDGYIRIYGDSEEIIHTDLRATLLIRSGNEAIVRFEWNPEYTFAQILDICGKVPIPPYLKRDSESEDIERYQTVYAINRGSVAAPTAGLHFTDNVLNTLKNRGINIERLSLHVGAGTFVPVKSELVSDHIMHAEPFTVSLLFLKRLRSQLGSGKVVAVGTTSARTLESLYYLGCRSISGQKPDFTDQWEPYESSYEISVEDSISALIKWVEDNGLNELTSRTRIIIVPGFKFRLTDILITNFHQPQSTLLLLISAFIGELWREAYDYALNNEFRFLSYGDSSIMFRY